MLVDTKELMFFLGDLGTEILPSLIDVFLVDTGENIKKISQSLENGDYESLAIEVHTLKGVGGTYGAVEMKEAAVNLDKRFKSKEALSSMRDDLLKLIDIMRATCSEMEKLKQECTSGNV